MALKLFGNFTEVSLSQSQNAPKPILVTLSGISIEVIRVPLNAVAPMLVTLPGIFIEVKDEQNWKAPYSIDVTPLGILTEA